MQDGTILQRTMPEVGHAPVLVSILSNQQLPHALIPGLLQGALEGAQKAMQEGERGQRWQGAEA